MYIDGMTPAEAKTQRKLILDAVDIIYAAAKPFDNDYDVRRARKDLEHQMCKLAYRMKKIAEGED